jgi:hypothetical protein
MDLSTDPSDQGEGGSQLLVASGQLLVASGQWLVIRGQEIGESEALVLFYRQLATDH